MPSVNNEGFVFFFLIMVPLFFLPCCTITYNITLNNVIVVILICFWSQGKVFKVSLNVIAIIFLLLILATKLRSLLFISTSVRVKKFLYHKWLYNVIKYSASNEMIIGFFHLVCICAKL